MFSGLFTRKTSLMDCGVLHGASDSHSHILFGVDDGIGTLSESLDAISAAEHMGVSSIWCTPHVMEDVSNTSLGLKQRFEQLRRAYSGKIRLSLAAEYMIDTLFEERLERNDLLTMYDDAVLVETSVWTPPFGLDGILHKVQGKGYNPVLAHPERYRYMKEDDYRKLFSMGVRFQLNLPSVAGYYGSAVRLKASWLLARGMYSLIGTDCHSASSLSEPYSTKNLTKEDARNLMLISEK